MRDAAVGHQCAECVREGSKTVRQAKTTFGGRVPAGATVTVSLIGINLAVYVLELSTAFVTRFQMWGVAMTNPAGQFFHYPGYTPQGYQEIGVAGGEWYRLLTGAFLHQPLTLGGFAIFHIAFNMWALYAVGPSLEQVLGRWRFLALYLLSALGGNVLQYLISPETPAVGASGAIFGLFGAYFVVAKRMNADVRGIVTLLVINLVITFAGASLISWQGHVGGLVTGLAITAAYVYSPQDKRTAFATGAATVAFALLAALVVYKTGQVNTGA
jgi:membrane associated rhomboid family serine protease